MKAVLVVDTQEKKIDFKAHATCVVLQNILAILCREFCVETLS